MSGKSGAKPEDASYVSYRVIGRNIRRVREQAELSQEELAERVGLSANHLGCAERGDRRLSINSIGQIALALKMPIEAIFKGSLIGGAEIAAELDGNEENKTVVRFREIIKGCPEGIAEMLLGVCKEIADYENK